jgi:flagellar hook-associated protein 1 FlgK
VEDPKNPGQPDPNGLGQIIVRSGNTVLVDRKTVPGQTLDANDVPVGPFTYNATTKKIQHDADGAGTGNAPVNFSASGKLQAQIEASYENITVSRAEIANLADQLTNSVNTLYSSVTGDPATQFFSAKAFADTPIPVPGTTPPQNSTANLNLSPGHGLEVGDQIRLADLQKRNGNTNETEAAGLAEGKTYFVKSVVGNVIQLSETKDGAAVSITSSLSPASTFRRIGDSLMGSPVVSADNLKASNTNGGNKVALDIAALASKRFEYTGTNLQSTGTNPDFISGSYTAYFNKTVTTVAQELNSTRIRLEDQKLSEEMARNSREQYSGVSQDEEVTDMMKFQRSFQASARHINVIDTLLEQVVNRLGVG